MPVDRIWNPYYQSKSYTTTRIYDISDKANPEIVRPSLPKERYYLTSRKSMMICMLFPTNTSTGFMLKTVLKSNRRYPALRDR